MTLMNGCGCSYCKEREERYRRERAALAATKHFTLDALEGIVADGKELELALLASANLIVLDKAQCEAKAGFEAGRRGLRATKETIG